MAALDFGMALARGMLPKSEKAQQDLLNLAGGRNVFKSEDWWNKAVDEQIKSGYRTVERQDQEFLMPTGEYKAGERKVSTSYGRTMFGSFYPISGSFGMPYTPSYSPIFGYGGGVEARTSVSYEAPEGAVFTVDPRTKEKQYTSRPFDVFGSKREDFTAGELKDIELGAKRGAEQAKRTAEESKRSTRRLARGTGGLVAKAILPGDKPATGLPSLGLTGLGLTTTALGKGLEL
jgi:hypothetical protein